MIENDLKRIHQAEEEAAGRLESSSKDFENRLSYALKEVEIAEKDFIQNIRAKSQEDLNAHRAFLEKKAKGVVEHASAQAEKITRDADQSIEEAATKVKEHVLRG